MREIKIVSIYVVIQISVMLFAYFLSLNGVRVPLSHVYWAMLSLISLWTAHRLRKQYGKARYVAEIRDLGLMFFFLGLFMFTLSLSYLVVPWRPDLYASVGHWAHRIGHIFLFTSLVFFVRVPLAWYRPKLKNIGSVFMAVLGMATIGVHFITPGSAEIIASGINIRQIDPLLGKLIVLNVVLGWVPAGIYFIYRAIKSADHVTRVRALLLGLGLLILTAGGPTHNISPEAIVFLFADILTLIGWSLLAFGVFYSAEKRSQMVSSVS